MTVRLFDVRPARATDAQFIADTWYMTVRCNSNLAIRVSNEDLSHQLMPLIDRALAGAGCWVAHVPDDPDLLLGCLVADPADRRVHHAYTKISYRRHGICRALLAAAGLQLESGKIYFSFPTKDLFEAIKAKRWDLRPEPFGAWRKYG